jgi:hypothetical protein
MEAHVIVCLNEKGERLYRMLGSGKGTGGPPGLQIRCTG